MLTTISGHSQQIDITAEGKASQSTEYNGGAFPAANAVDGDTTTFSHTDVNTAGNHWLLTFDSERQISRIEVVAREDCCGGRLTNAVLRVADDEGESVFAENITDPGQGGTATFTLPEATFGKSVRIGFEEEQTNSEGNRVVHLGEVRVLGGEAEKLAILSFKAEPDSIPSGGQATLSWATEHADSVMIVGIGDVPTSGTVDVNLASSTLYTLVATAKGQTAVATIGVAVDGLLLAPRISEFMAAPAEGADWIELQNPNNAAFLLEGYGLRDSESGEPWIFPAETVIESNGFLVIEAGGAGESGVPFGLAREDGERIALIAPDGTVVSEFVYPEQRSGVSYGLAPDGEVRYFTIPSRGSANGFGVAGFVADTAFSVDRGFFQQPFELSITSATEGAAIWFTVDGTKPSPDNPAAGQFLAPFTIDKSTVVRAAAFRDGWQPTNIDTQTYLFLADVVRQPEEPEGFPTSWGNGPGVQASMPARADYEMDPRVVDAAPFTDLEGEEFSMEDALLAIPTMSLVMDIDDLLDPTDGLYARARNRGIAWEREASVEIIDPATDRAVQANCGIRMQGGWNRFPEMLKKSFRLYFRGEYGDGKLRYPLFPDSDVEAFDRLVLRSGNGKAWPSPWRALSGGGNSLPRTTYLRDQFVRDTQRALGGETAQGMFVHLYINGLYWGLYNPCERLDEKFAAAHFGGDAEDWDVVKWIRGNGGLQLVAGTTDPWNELMRRVRRNQSDPENYAAVLELLDPANLADYMIANMYAGNIDWQDNNSYAMRNRAGDGRFRFSSWDAEETFLSSSDNTSTQNVSNTATEIFTRLRASDEFRILFADRLQRHYFDGGALSPEIAESRWLGMAAWIDRAVVGESARWGDLMRPSRPYTRDIDWVKEIENIRSSYIGVGRSSNRTTATFSQFARLGLYPDLNPPLVSDPAGGVVDENHVVRLENPEGQEATLYFTTDGTDPRDPGGAVSATAQIFSGGVISNIVINASDGDAPGSIWKFHDSGADLSDSGWNDPGYDDSEWQAGPSELGYGDRDEETTVSFGDDAGQKPITTWFRHSFDLSATGVASIDRVVELSARIKVDDGAVVYGWH
ncbi:MAG: CotH kinase family protein [Verrucomicrobiales bacterium]